MLSNVSSSESSVSLCQCCIDTYNDEGDDDIDDNDDNDNDNDNDEDQTCLVSLPGVGRTPKPWLARVVRKVVWLN